MRTRPCGRGQRPQPGDTERQLITALGPSQRVHFVQHDTRQGGEQRRGIRQRQQYRKALGCGEQDMRRDLALAGAPVGGRVAGTGLDADRQIDLLDRPHEVAGNIDRKRLQWADVEGVQTLPR